MQNKLFVLIAVSILSTSALAAQCPAFTEFSHQKGQQWQLSLAARADGWVVDPSSNKNSDQTTVPKDGYLQARLFDHTNPRSYDASCVYSIPFGESLVMVVNQTYHVDWTQPLQSFTWNYAEQDYICGFGMSHCAWRWLA